MPNDEPEILPVRLDPAIPVPEAVVEEPGDDVAVGELDGAAALEVAGLVAAALIEGQGLHVKSIERRLLEKTKKKKTASDLFKPRKNYSRFIFIKSEALWYAFS